MKPTTYKGYKGFYDLREFDIPKKEFVKLVRIQEFLYTVETNRQKGKIHPQIEQIRQLSADYQAALFAYPSKK